MDFVAEMKKKAVSFGKSLVLPEGTEERTVQAAAKIKAEGIAKTVILLGEESEVKKVAAEKNVNLNGIEIIKDIAMAKRVWRRIL